MMGFLFLFLGLLFVALFVFLLFHLFLVFTNRTTNEICKSRKNTAKGETEFTAGRKSINNVTKHTLSGRKNAIKSRKSGKKVDYMDNSPREKDFHGVGPSRVTFFGVYHRGVVGNILEVLSG